MNRQSIIKGIYPPKMSREYALQQISNAYAQSAANHPTVPQQTILIGGGGGGVDWETSSNLIQPTGVAKLGQSYRVIHSDHSHPTATILETNPQPPVLGEIRRTSSFNLVIWTGSAWQQVGGVPPYTATPNPTGLASSGSVNQYSRGDHSHATALLLQTNSQTPVERELRYDSSDALVMRVGSNWVPVKIDWVNVLNKPTNFPITVRRNSGSNVGTRPRLNFIEGSNITITVADDSGDNEIDITIASTVSSINPYNTTPQPTGVASAGTSTNYSRGDHSHATALIPQSDAQAPVSDELRYNSAGQLVRRIGSNWVVVGSAPVRETNSYSEQGQNDGEIWYRSNDRALFFRIGGQRVYPAAALFTESESAANTGAGNRMLILSSSSTNILKVGGGVDQNVFAYPKLPIISGQMSSSNANWGSGAGTTPTGALWWNTSTGRPEFYPNAFTPEPFYVERLFIDDGYATSAFGEAIPGRIRVRRGGMLYASDGTHTTVPTAFYRVWKPSETLILSATGVNHITGSGTENLANAYYEGNYSLLNRDTLEWGDDSAACGVLIPVGLVQIRGGGSFRLRFWTLLQTTTTTANNPSFQLEIGLRRLASSTSTESFYTTTTTHTRTQVGQNLYLVVFSLTPNLSASWSRYVNGTASGSQAPPDDLYLFVLGFRRVRSSETAPRWVFNMRWFACECSLPIMRLPMP